MNASIQSTPQIHVYLVSGRVPPGRTRASTSAEYAASAPSDVGSSLMRQLETLETATKHSLFEICSARSFLCYEAKSHANSSNEWQITRARFRQAPNDLVFTQWPPYVAG
ncbi:hypothetical protein DL765_005570 [Monosporascus sp. GIB2]|nr:hypothetical protein DL765_005570 [Monosporascus sp. GIB2]